MSWLITFGLFLAAYAVVVIVMRATGKLDGDWDTLIGRTQLAAMPIGERIFAVVGVLCALVGAILIFGPWPDIWLHVCGVAIVIVAFGGALILKRRRHRREKP